MGAAAWREASLEAAVVAMEQCNPLFSFGKLRKYIHTHIKIYRISNLIF
jgi:hypothetical protein